MFAFTMALPTTAPIPLVWQTVRIPGIGDGLVLAWTNSSFSLQAGPEATGPYTNIPGATSPYAVSTGSSRMFFRLEANP